MAGYELAAEDTTPRVETRFWLLTCNGAKPGRLVTYVDAHFCAHQPGVVGTLPGPLVWTHRGTQDPRSPEREFRLEPLTDNQARAWIRANHTTTR